MRINKHLFLTQKFHAFYYNQSTIQPENKDEPALVEAERLYEKMLENITNKGVTNLSDNTSPMSSFAQQESLGQNSDDMQTASSDYLYGREECTLSHPEDKERKRNLFKDRTDIPAGHRVISYPNYGQAFHPNFDTEV